MQRRGALARFLRATEIDTRMLGMVGALLVIWIGFDISAASSPATASRRLFLTPRNLWNLSVQTSSVAVMATGMVLVIVMRNIDLSVGSILGFVGMIIGVLQVDSCSAVCSASAIPRSGSSRWSLGIVARRRRSARFQGLLIAYAQIPAFIVTLGGLLVWRGAAWWVTSGADGRADGHDLQADRRRTGQGSIGATWSWIVGVVACVGDRRRHPRRPPRSASASTSRCARSGPRCLLGVVACAAVLGAVWIVNSYPWPVRHRRRSYAEAQRHRRCRRRRPASSPHGIAIPVLIALAVGIVMTFIATRTRFGRYVFAIGGNPEAAELAGINTSWLTMKVFTLMGVLVGDRRGDLVGPPQRRHQRARHARRALRDRRRRHRRHVARRRHRHDRRRHARRAADAVAAIGHGAARRRHRRCRTSSSASCWSSRSGSTVYRRRVN